MTGGRKKNSNSGKRLAYLLGAVLLLGAFLLMANRFSSAPAGSAAFSVITFSPRIPPTPSVQIGRTVIPVEVAKDSAAVQKGLSGRQALAPDRGMLFVFSAPARYNFWMPDMHFRIDIIWINGGKVIGIEKDVSNEFDPANPRLYKPPRPAQYVVEVNAGFAARKSIGIGDPVVFHYIKT